MTKEEALTKMKAISDGSHYTSQKHSDGSPRLYDAENQHCDADDVLCEFLRSLGYGELVDAFNSVDKWYA